MTVRLTAGFGGKWRRRDRLGGAVALALAVNVHATAGVVQTMLVRVMVHVDNAARAVPGGHVAHECAVRKLATHPARAPVVGFDLRRLGLGLEDRLQDSIGCPEYDSRQRGLAKRSHCVKVRGVRI